MEKNIHDDRLNDYVKKSFDDYTEDPANDMWDRIEEQLPAPEERKPFWYSYRWQMAAAAVILLLISRLVFVQVYYEEKLRSINDHQQQNLNSPSKEITSAEKVINPSSNNTQAGSENRANDKANDPTNSPNNNSAIKNRSIENIKDGRQVGAPTLLPDKHRTSIHTQDNRSPEKGTQTPVLPVAQNQVPVEGPIATPVTPALTQVSKIANFQSLESKISVLSFERDLQPTPVIAPIKKFKSPNGWYAGLSITPHLIIEKAITVKRLGARHLFANQQEKPQVSANIAVRLGKKINHRFAIESGIGFQSFTRNATHLARFEYQDGRAIQNPGGLESRSFDYDLNTYGGSASVSLRTEVRGSDVPASKEGVVALVKSKETIQVLHIPLLGVARMDHGRTQLVLKAGLTGSYLAKNQLELQVFSLQNDKLRLRDKDGFSVQYDRPQHFILGYQFGAGLEFRLQKNLSLAITPTLSGEFKRQDALLGRLPGHSSFGMNLGANWWF